MIRLAASGWTLLCGLYFLWEALSYRGFFAWLAELQIGQFGHYVPLLTFLALLCVCALPAVLIARVILKSSNDTASLTEMLELRRAEAHRLRRWLVAFGTAAMCMAVGFSIYSSFMLPDQEGELQTISAREFGAVPIKEGPLRLVGGELGLIVFFGQDWLVGDDRMAFSPYRPATSNSQPAQIFVQLEAGNQNEARAITQRPSWSGILVQGGLPGPVRSLFHQMGVGIAGSHYTLYQTEYAMKVRYWLQAIQWALLAVFFGILIALQSRTIMRIEKLRAQLPT